MLENPFLPEKLIAKTTEDIRIYKNGHYQLMPAGSVIEIISIEAPIKEFSSHRIQFTWDGEVFTKWVGLHWENKGAQRNTIVRMVKHYYYHKEHYRGLGIELDPQDE